MTRFHSAWTAITIAAYWRTRAMRAHSEEPEFGLERFCKAYQISTAHRIYTPRVEISDHAPWSLDPEHSAIHVPSIMEFFNELVGSVEIGGGELARFAWRTSILPVRQRRHDVMGEFDIRDRVIDELVERRSPPGNRCCDENAARLEHTPRFEQRSHTVVSLGEVIQRAEEQNNVSEP